MVLLLFALCILYGLVLSVEGSVAEFKPVFGPPVGITKEQREHLRIPYVDGGQVFIHGQIKTYQGKVTNVTSPILDLETNQPIVIGRMAQMTEDDLPSITEAATQAWDDGQGVWPQMTFAGRIAALERAVELLRLRREEIIDILVWEICKVYSRL
ncbi:aldehyde dehydrogenase family protein [archaeon]|nr:MAG: aldehyde dehydrogenase family protein [archaeon]